tara:strand:- start:1145 stop:1429 length:285 start_codon:yes stop_codon:yes gene_type:complete
MRPIPPIHHHRNASSESLKLVEFEIIAKIKFTALMEAAAKTLLALKFAGAEWEAVRGLLALNPTETARKNVNKRARAPKRKRTPKQPPPPRGSS